MSFFLVLERHTERSPDREQRMMTVADIETLSLIEKIRLRPAMYIGGTDSIGLHHLAWEVIDNSFDEYESGNATSVHIRLHADGSLSCEDDGAGIPVDPLMSADQRPWIEVVCTEFFAGGRFQRKRYGAGSFHGVGLVAVNALSEWLIIETNRHGKRWRIRFEQGKVVQGLEEMGLSRAPGTRVWFKPDPQIFGGTPLDYEVLRRRLQIEASLWPGVTCTIFDCADGRHETFHSVNGAADLVRARTAGSTPLYPDVIRIQARDGATTLDCAMQHRVGVEHLCDAYVNGMHLIEGGTVITGLQHGLTSAIRKHAREHDLSADETLTAEHCLTGLLSVISVRLERPHFEGPTRNRISNPELAEFTSRTIANGLTTYFSEHPQTADMICRAAVSRSQNR